MGMKNFNGKVVWITGASSGIGEALVRQFSEFGAKLILSSRRLEALEKVASDCDLNEESKLILPIDLSEYKDYQPYVKKVVEKFGRIDVLINNGGISQRSRFAETELSVFK
ncbi:MAG: SDR family NAD(P)-dependent oxidoreductase, partial [Flammeovirgaceae bacterium]|nr:SDR family NAD(P)-dependent oxidoreductase [Flammeovirgaceae bacterium]